MGHNVNILNCDSVLIEFINKKKKFQVSPLQESEPYTCGWLIWCHVQTFNCNNFTKLLQAHPKLKNIPICCKNRPIELKKEDKNYLGQFKTCYACLTIPVLKTIFNRNRDYDMKQRLEGLDLKFIKYYGIPISPDLFLKQFMNTQKAVNIQKYLKYSVKNKI